MAKTLGSWLRSQMEACGLNNKDVAGRVHDLLASAGVVASLDSVTTKFSKLLNGHEEGTTYYYADSEPARLEALAAALKTTATELQQRRAASLRYRTLVLDPRLPKEQIEFLMRQEQDPAAAYSVVMPRDGLTDPAGAIKAAMVAAERPLAVLFGGGIASSNCSG